MEMEFNITEKMNDNEKIRILINLSEKLSEICSISDSVYIGRYNDCGLYLSINTDMNLFYTYLGYHIRVNKNDNGNVFITEIDNLKLFIKNIDNENKKENEFFKNLKSIL